MRLLERHNAVGFKLPMCKINIYFLESISKVLRWNKLDHINQKLQYPEIFFEIYYIVIDIYTKSSIIRRTTSVYFIFSIVRNYLLKIESACSSYHKCVVVQNRGFGYTISETRCSMLALLKCIQFRCPWYEHTFEQSYNLLKIEW